MSELGYVPSILLGLVQGVTEFLPVSSSGHLVIVQRLLGLAGDSPTMLLFDIAVHVGTLAAVFAVFAGTFRNFALRLRRELSPSYRGKRTALLIAGLATAATIPTGVIGLAFKDWFKSTFASLAAVGLGLIATGTLLWAVSRIPRPRRGWRRIGWARAAGVGVLQGCAILPGVSRSGATICGAMMLGVKRRWAAEFSFLIAVPAIVGAALLELRETLRLPAEVLAATPWGPILAGALTAAVSGTLALRVLMKMVIRNRIGSFRYYCWGLGIVVMGWWATT